MAYIDVPVFSRMKQKIIWKSDRNIDSGEEVGGKLMNTNFITGLKGQKMYLFAVY